MDVSLQVARFLYRLRYKILFPSIFVALVVAYFTQFLPNQYTVVASVFTGIASNKGLDNNTRSDYLTLSNTFDNIINYTKSKGSLEQISTKLIAQSLMHGSIINNNKYISAKNYIYLLETTPKEVLDLVNKNSLDTTLNNIKKYKQSSIDNFFYQIYNSTNAHYGYEALKSINIHRVNTSDLIDLSFTADDPGMASNTVILITDELIKSHHTFKYKSSNEVVKYYEEQLRRYKSQLNTLEDELQNYNVKYKIINYTDQTKELSVTMSEFEVRYEQVLMEYTRSLNLIKVLEAQLIVRNQLYSTNGEFLQALDKISSISGKISESEMFNKSDDLEDLTEELEQRQKLADAEMSLKDISNRMRQAQYSKEGVVVEDIITQWLNETINFVKAKADLAVLGKRRKYYEDQLIYYSPVGTQLSRMEREISVIEQSYLNTLHHLGLARQRNNSIKLESSSPEIITPATYPVSSNGSKRHVFVFVAFMATLILIASLEIIIEVMDRTLRDPLRAKKLTSLEVIGAFLGPKQFRYRGYTRDNNRISARVICNKLNHFLSSEQVVYVNVLSIECNEGKNFATQYLKNEWEAQGLVVEVLKYDEDYACDVNYLRAQSLDFFVHKPADVVFIKYPPFSKQSIPPVFLRESSINILVANASRGWRASDNEYVKCLHKDMGNKILLILNNTNRDYLEDLIGELSIHKRNNSFADKLKHLAFTSDVNALK